MDIGRLLKVGTDFKLSQAASGEVADNENEITAENVAANRLVIDIFLPPLIEVIHNFMASV
ncbi:hypothetical protein CO662_36695 [Rhizobium anhuiense]|uniref:Uncharacterized protein n=1 Tax=Rhizobium anhuiense TaxID=1184720 RepID=A0ABX4IZ25_9HYPH|nr:hypothetical protein CO668_18785 [Rhizobium anhuiense]PDS45777.1 hypothetical protein CO662_36695 [Rhizobium anhuiense]